MINRHTISPRTAVMLAACFCLFLFLGSHGLYEPDEGRYGEASREMALQSNWLVPHLAGVPHLQKPPLVYWITATCIKLFGVNEWAARLTPAFSALGILLLTMHLAGLLFGKTIEWKAGVILLSSGLFFTIARILTADMLLTFWITGAIVAYVHYTKRNSLFALLLFYLCLGLGFLTKGPMAYLVPFSAVIPWAIAARRETNPPGRYWHWLPGLSVALAISASWFVVLFHHHPELIDYYFKQEFVERIASDIHNRSKPIWFYSMVLTLGFLPWSITLPRIIYARWKRRGEPRSPAFWMLCGWILIPWLVLHLVTSKLPTYILPLFPPLAIVIAHELERLQSRSAPEIRWLMVVFSILTAGIPFLIRLYGRSKGFDVPIDLSFLAIWVLISIGWIYAYIDTSFLPSATTLITRLSVLTLISMLFMASHADEFVTRRNKSMNAIANDIRSAQRQYPNATLMAVDMKKFGLEFYLQQPIMRSTDCVEKTLPIPEDRKHLFVDNCFEFIRANHQQDFLLLMSQVKAPDPIPSDWTIIEKYNTMLLVHRAGKPSNPPPSP